MRLLEIHPDKVLSPVGVFDGPVTINVDYIRAYREGPDGVTIVTDNTGADLTLDTPYSEFHGYLGAGVQILD